MQLKRHSLIETVISTVVGFLLTLIFQSILFPLYGIHISTSQNLQIVAFMTFISIARGYILRRIFNHYTGATR